MTKTTAHHRVVGQDGAETGRTRRHPGETRGLAGLAVTA
jgi:hypothetical protein